MVGFHEELCPRLGRRVGVGRFQDVLFFHGLGFKCFTLTVNLVGGDVDESFNTTMTLGRLEQYVRAEDIALGEVERVPEGIVDMCLCREVHDGIDFFFRHYVGDEVWTGDIPLDEFEVLKTGDIVEIGEAGAVVEFVVDHNLVVGVFLREEDGHMRPNES